MRLRAITAFVAIPGLVAFVIPVATGILTGHPMQHEVPAAVLVLVGTALLVWCVREFYVAGRGTLAPWARPKHLVTTGPYRFSRNPMYVATLTILMGWCLLWDSPGLHIHAFVTLVVVVARVCLLEEVWVGRQFGPEWERYRARTPRWLLPLRRVRVPADEGTWVEKSPKAAAQKQHGAMLRR